PPLREMRRGADAGNAGSYARDNRFIIWTGHSYNDKPESGRSRAMSEISETEIGTPIPERELFRRAAQAGGEKGYDPAFVKQAVWNHNGPDAVVVYLYVEADEEGNYRALREIHAGPARRLFKRGEVVRDRHGRMYVDCHGGGG
ncbi:hypothetical protein ACFQS7_29645, partial [Dankookia sp. GCM10030260]|uniref:hypothetical protein n=1 Tax=Dankookia sp. GCM10030260 TaxID=3273390 RepID=UPI003611EB82